MRIQYNGLEINPMKAFEIFCSLYHFGNFENIDAIFKRIEEKGYTVILPEKHKFKSNKRIVA